MASFELSGASAWSRLQSDLREVIERCHAEEWVL
jgi:hypothetical protein